MAIVIKIGATEYTAGDSSNEKDGFDWTTLNVTDVMAPTGDVASLSGFFTYPYEGRIVMPETEQELRITFQKSTDRVATTLFGGIIEQMSAKVVGPSQISVDISARDYVKWLNQKLVSGVFTDTAADDMVKSILASFSTGFTTTNVEVVADILPKVFNFVSVSEAIQEIADTVGASWYVDVDRDVHFFKADNVTNIAPLAAFNVDTEKKAGSFQYSKDTTGIQNALVVKDFHFRSPNLIYIPPNAAENGFGSDISFDTNEIAKRSTDIPEIPYDTDDFTFSVKPSGGAYSNRIVLWDQIASQNGANDTDPNAVYVDVKNLKVRWGSGAGIIASDSIRISYRPLFANLFPQLAREVYSIEEFSRREGQGGRISDGIYERLINFTDLEFTGTDPIEAFLQFGNTILKNHAWPVISGKFSCLSIDYPGWTAGQTFTVFSEIFDIYDLQQWVQDGRLAEKQPIKVWVQSVGITAISTEVLKYDISFSSVATDI